MRISSLWHLPRAAVTWLWRPAGLGGSGVVVPFGVFRFGTERVTIETLASPTKSRNSPCSNRAISARPNRRAVCRTIHCTGR